MRQIPVNPPATRSHTKISVDKKPTVKLSLWKLMPFENSQTSKYDTLQTYTSRSQALKS